MFSRQHQQRGTVALPGNVPCYISSKGRKFVGPKIPRLSSIDRRRETLNGLPAYLNQELQDAESIVKSGLYYDGRTELKFVLKKPFFYK